MTYQAPLKDMLFVMEHLANLDGIAALPGFEDHGLETAEAVLEESARFCEGVVAPLNVPGDKNPSSWKDGEVSTTPGFKQAFAQFAAGGWQGVVHPVEHGGQGLPKLIATGCMEMLHAANLSFALCPMLTDGAIEALLTAGSDTLKQLYLEKMISGQWTGTMNLTEPQAGSDLAAVRTRAERQDDGSYKLFGTKIFITYGEHDMAENIVHLVLARVSGAPEGVKGISLFLVPKFQVQPDGSLGPRNDAHCISIEHKLGIKASPTAVLQFGEHGGAIGRLVGEENRGLEYMFIMMNAARFAVGMQGIAVSDRAYQQAVAFARLRLQSRDLAHHAPDAQRRAQHQALYDYLVPVVKGFSTELAVDVTSLGVQVHGGMGFIEETGAAQHYRDARILSIYEGTTAIQANDLVGRKTLRDGGAMARQLCAWVASTEEDLAVHGEPECALMRAALTPARQALEAVIEHVLAHGKSAPKAVYAGAVTYLKLAGYVLCGWQMARALMVALEKRNEDPAFYEAKVHTAVFYAQSLLPLADALACAVVQAGANTQAMPAELF